MRFLAALSLCLLIPATVEARPSFDLSGEFRGERWHVAQAGTTASDINRIMGCPPPYCLRVKVRHRWKTRPKRIKWPGPHTSPVVKESPIPFPVARPAGAPEPDEEAAATNAVWERIAVALRADEAPRHLNIFQGFWREIMRAVPRGRSLAGIVKPLAAKVTDLASLCPGTVVISTIRLGARVRGSGRPSLHRYGKAVDIAGNYRCLYAALRGFPGGVSTDAHRVRHIHISWDVKGREWGRRFAHWQPGARRTRYARHHKIHRTQYASAR